MGRSSARKGNNWIIRIYCERDNSLALANCGLGWTGFLVSLVLRGRVVLTAEGVVGGVPPVALVEPAAAGGVTGGASVPVSAEG